MAEVAEDAAPEIVSAFPLPPAFFALYRDGADAGPRPPAPMEPQYHMFGTPFSTQDVVPDLLPMPGQKLYLSAASATSESNGPDGADATSSSSSSAVAVAGDAESGAEDASAAVAKTESSPSGGAEGAVDFKRQMKKINHSLLANFLELVDVLIKQPALFNEKLADLELLFLNMHNLINTFRPHQARETIIHMLQMQIQERRDAAHDIRKTIDDARRNVEDVHGELHDHTTDEMRSQDAADIKMEDVSHDSDASPPSTSAGSSAVSGSGSATPAAASSSNDVSAKARHVQQMQESFFSALQSIAGATQ